MKIARFRVAFCVTSPSVPKAYGIEIFRPSSSSVLVQEL